MQQNVMGVDLSSRSVAMSTIENTAKIKIPDRIKDRFQIERSLYENGLSVLRDLTPEYVFIEEPVVAGARNIRSSLLIAQTCGVVMAACAAADISHVYLVPVSTWKKETVGHGGADKQRVCTWFDQNYSEVSAKCGGDQDLIDATCICLYGQRLLGRVDDVSDGLSHESRLSGVA